MNFDQKYQKVRTQMEQSAHASFDDIKLSEAVDNGKLSCTEQDTQAIFDPHTLVGYPTGFCDLDKIVGGIRLGTCSILAADTGMGKSLLAIKMLTHMAKNGVRVCYFDLENGRTTSLKRIFGIWHGVHTDWFKDDANKEKMPEMFSEIVNFDYYDHDKLYDLGFKERRYELVLDIMDRYVKLGTKVFLIDPLQIFGIGLNKYKAASVIDEAVTKLKEFAQSRGVAVIICHHIRKSESGGGTWVKDISDAREVMYKVPTLEDIKGSSTITQTATDVWGLVRTKLAEKKKDQGNSILTILKNRNGPEGFIELYLEVETLQFNAVKPFDVVKAFSGGLDLDDSAE